MRRITCIVRIPFFLTLFFTVVLCDTNRKAIMSFETDVVGRSQQGQRELDDAGYYYNYFADQYGYAYEPYSLSWRYLGMYIDCDIEGANNAYDGENGDEDDGDDGDEEDANEGNGGGRRHLENDQGNDCSRKVRPSNTQKIFSIRFFVYLMMCRLFPTLTRVFHSSAHSSVHPSTHPPIHSSIE